MSRGSIPATATVEVSTVADMMVDFKALTVSPPVVKTGVVVVPPIRYHYALTKKDGKFACLVYFPGAVLNPTEMCLSKRVDEVHTRLWAYEADTRSPGALLCRKEGNELWVDSNLLVIKPFSMLSELVEEYGRRGITYVPIFNTAWYNLNVVAKDLSEKAMSPGTYPYPCGLGALAKIMWDKPYAEIKQSVEGLCRCYECSDQLADAICRQIQTEKEIAARHAQIAATDATIAVAK